MFLFETMGRKKLGDTRTIRLKVETVKDAEKIMQALPFIDTIKQAIGYACSQAVKELKKGVGVKS